MRVLLPALLLVLPAFACGDSAVPDLAAEASWRMEVASCWNVSIAFGDLNGDGIEDMVLAKGSCDYQEFSDWLGATEITVHEGQKEGFATAPALTLTLPLLELQSKRIVRLLDADGDGVDDLLIRDLVLDFTDFDEKATMYMGTPDWASIGNGIETLGLPVRYRTGDPQSLIGDIDGDGRDEIVEARDGTLFVREWDGTAREWIDSPLGDADQVVQHGDADGDGASDLLVEYEGQYRTVFGCANTSCRISQTRPDIPLPAFESMPIGFEDINGDGRAELVTYSVGRALEMHLSTENHFSLVADWHIAPDAIDWELRPRFSDDIDLDGSPADFLISSNERTMLFQSGDDGRSVEVVYEWPRLFPLGSAHWDKHTLLFQLRPTDRNTSVWIEGYTMGRVPEEAPTPRFSVDFVCPIRDVDAADIGVDQELIAKSLDVHYQEFTADSCELAEACVGGPGRRKLLDFSVAVQNFGGGVATIPSPEVLPEIWHADACHGHDHLIGFASYDLLDDAGTSFVAGHKQGYYIVDVFPYCDLPSVAERGDLSISPGWSDIYYAGQDCQWIDITGVPDGEYTLQVIVNANQIIPEDDVVSNTASVAVRIAGDEVLLR